MAKFVVAAIQERLQRFLFELAIVPGKDLIYHGGCGIVVMMRPTIRLGDNFVNDFKFLEIRRCDAQRLRGNLLRR